MAKSNAHTSNEATPDDAKDTNTPEPQFTKDLGFIPIPKRLCYDPKHPPHFGLLLNVYFGFASTFTVANLYYNQPILIELANAFGVSYDEVSRIPTLVQAGYAIGLALISPLGDLVRRRQLLLILVLLSASLSIGLAVTSNLVAFETLSFLIGAVTVTPQVLLPLAADLAPPERRATALSVVFTGLIFGVLVARVISGIIAEYTTYRVIFYLAIGLQYVILGGIYLVIPDYPAKNQNMNYFQILWSMVRYCFTEPILIQACLINMASSACFSNFWVTLTFLLGGPPYNYSTLVIGLFGLIGMWGVAMGPLVGRTIDKLVPWYASLVSIIFLGVFQSVQVGAGGIHIAAVIVAILGIDVFRQALQISLATNIFSIAPEARARLNAVFILSLFIGQVMGTAVGTRVFLQYGWRAGAALSLGWTGWQLLVLLVRGPHCDRYTWFGYQGGIECRKAVVDDRKRQTPENLSSTPEKDKEQVGQGGKGVGEAQFRNEQGSLQPDEDHPLPERAARKDLEPEQNV